MDRLRVFPDFRGEWIVYEDAQLIAIDKPAFVPSQASEEGATDDVVSRLSRFLVARDGRAPSLGVHQRLDRDTSGLLVYAKTKEANLVLARAFETRTVEKKYVAIARTPRKDRFTLRDRIARSKDGRMEVSRSQSAKEAITHVRVLETRGARALLEVEIETGRTHQIRTQLAHGGSPVCGDRLYGGDPAPRLMLHASSLVVAGKTFASRAPFSLGDALDLEDPAAIARAVRGAAESRFGLVHAEGTTAVRLVNDEGDGVPGVAIDLYGDFLVVHLSSDEAVRHREAILDACAVFDAAGVYLKLRPKQANELVDTHRDDVAPSAAVRGVDAPDPLIVREHGVAYRAHLGDGLGTGLYLDQRENRRRVAELARGRSLLNLFAYTCGFTVAAKGAARTVSVDASKRAIEEGARNVGEGPHLFVHEDAFEHLARAAKRGDTFDVVVLDPPTYATTRKGRFRSGRDWVALAAQAMRVVAKGGVLFASSNDRRMPLLRFRRYLHEAAREAGRSCAQMKDASPPADFPAPPGSEPHLKAVYVTLD